MGGPTSSSPAPTAGCSDGAAATLGGRRMIASAADCTRLQADHADLRHEIIHLAAATTTAITTATDALAQSDLGLASEVINNDDQVDALAHVVADHCFELLGREPGELQVVRFLVTAMRVAAELERSADLMVNVAKATWRLYPNRLDDTARALLDRISRQACLQTRVAVNAFVDLDTAAGAALDEMDQVIDDLDKALLSHVLRTRARDEAGMALAVQLALVTRYYERVGDHAVTIGERARFVVRGRQAVLTDGQPAGGVGSGNGGDPRPTFAPASPSSHDQPSQPRTGDDTTPSRS